jgi:hypothetical protein
MPKFTGHYVIDLDASAQLHVGYFTDRFEMKPVYENAMQKYMRAHAEVAKKITLTLDRENLRLKTADEEEVFPVKSLVQDGDKPQLVVLAGGRFSMTCELRELGPDLVQYSNHKYDLHNWAWRRTGDV